MGLLDGRKALVFGVANDHSIAWGIAKAFHDEGAVVGFSSVESLIERRVRPLADSPSAARSSSPATSPGTTTSARVMTTWHAQQGEHRHPGPRHRLREARGPRRLLHRHLARRVRARARRVRLLAGRAGPRGPAVPPPRLLDPHPQLLRRREGRDPLQRDGRGQGGPRGVGALPGGRPRARRHPGQRHLGRARSGRCRRAASRASASCTARSTRSRRCAPTSRSRTAARPRSTSRSDLSSAVTGEVIYVDGGFNILGVPSAGD